MLLGVTLLVLLPNLDHFLVLLNEALILLEAILDARDNLSNGINLVHLVANMLQDLGHARFILFVVIFERSYLVTVLFGDTCIVHRQEVKLASVLQLLASQDSLWKCLE